MLDGGWWCRARLVQMDEGKRRGWWSEPEEGGNCQTAKLHSEWSLGVSAFRTWAWDHSGATELWGMTEIRATGRSSKDTRGKARSGPRYFRLRVLLLLWSSWLLSWSCVVPVFHNSHSWAITPESDVDQARICKHSYIMGKRTFQKTRLFYKVEIWEWARQSPYIVQTLC